MLVQELRTIAPYYLVHEMKNNTLFLDCRDAHSPDYMIFMHNLGCVVQNWEITLSYKMQNTK